MRLPSMTGTLRIAAGIGLAVAWFLPLYSLPGGDGSTTRVSAWQVALEGWADAALLALAFFWPLVPVVLRGGARRGRELRRGAALLVEPWLAWFSAGSILAASVAFGYVGILPPWLMVPVSSEIGGGALTGVAANGLYLLAWSIDVVALIATRLRSGPGLRHACC